MPLDFEEDFETYAGTRLLVKEGRPTANTEVAWETFFGASGAAEITITGVGITSGRSYATASVSVVSSGRVREKLGEFTYGQTDFPVLWLKDEPGQVMAREANETRAILSFAEVSALGEVTYFTAQVMTFQPAGGANNDARTGTMTLLRQSDAVVAETPVLPLLLDPTP